MLKSSTTLTFPLWGAHSSSSAWAAANRNPRSFIISLIHSKSQRDTILFFLGSGFFLYCYGKSLRKKSLTGNIEDKRRKFRQNGTLERPHSALAPPLRISALARLSKIHTLTIIPTRLEYSKPFHIYIR